LTSVAHTRIGKFLGFFLRPTQAAVLMAVIGFMVCYFRSFVFPNVPIALWGDQVGFFNDGSRMVLGQLPYHDYFQIVPPGTDLVYALLIRCFGVRMWIPNLLMAALAGITALLTTLIASRLVRGPILMLPGLFLAGLALLPSMEATHHWFSTVALLAAMLVLLGGATLPRVAVAGGLCGVAACFTQTKGAAALGGLVVYLIWSDWKRTTQREYCLNCLALCGAAAAVFGAVNAYFIGAAGLSQWLFCVVVYPLRYYPAPPFNNWRVLIYDFGSHPGIVRWTGFPFMYGTIPLVYILFLMVAGRRWPDLSYEGRRKLLLVVVLGIAMFVAIAPSPSVKRLATVSPPGMIVLAWLLDRPGKIATYVKLGLSAVALVLAIAIPVRVQTKWHGYLDLPGGRTAFLDPGLYEEYRWLPGNTHPGQYFFGLPPLYYAFHMRNPAEIEGYHASEYTRPQQVIALVEALERHSVPLMVIRQSDTLLRETGSPSDHLTAFRVYLKQNYQLTHTFSTGDDVLERIEVTAQGATNPD